jgi:hypothetical protein
VERAVEPPQRLRQEGHANRLALTTYQFYAELIWKG